MRVTFTVPGKPRGKGRPRVVGGHAFTDEKTYQYEQLIKISYLNSVPAARRMHEGPLLIELQADFAPPASWSQKRKDLAAKGGLKHTSKPDLDNIVKCLDALNGLAWHDDSQIIGIVARKEYRDRDMLTISIAEAEG